MRLLDVIARISPRVEVRIIKHMSTDIRDPFVAHRARRARECRKIAPAMPFMPQLPGMFRRQAD